MPIKVGDWVLCTESKNIGPRIVVSTEPDDGYFIRYPALRGPQWKELIWVLQFQHYRFTVLYQSSTVISRAVAAIPLDIIYGSLNQQENVGLGKRSFPANLIC